MPQKPTLDKLFQQIYQSYKAQKRRNPVGDFETLLRLKKINYQVYSQTKNVAKIPTIIAANHFVRPLFPRRSFLTTIESMITSAVITHAASSLVDDKITWVVKNDLRENLFFLNIKVRKIQLASIYTHSFIGVSQNYPFGEFQQWAKFLKAGYSIGLYPEGLVSSQMREAKPGFDKLLSYLKSRGVLFQILPVGIYYENGTFFAQVSAPIVPRQDCTETANSAMASIANSLPIHLQGFYKQKARHLKAQARQQQAGDQIQEHQQPQEISA